MTVFAIKKLRMKKTQWNLTEEYWSTGFLGKEVGYEISTSQMQYDAADKKTDQKDPCFIYLGGN